MTRAADGYVAWKGWSEDEFGKVHRHASRYYDWHLRRAVGACSNLKVLEVGFGNGSFLGHCRSRGCDVSAIEIDPHLRERAARAADVGSLPEGELFDVIALFDVLEHIPAAELVGFVRALAARLSPEGALLLRLPNGDSPFGRRHQHGDLTHVTAFGEFKLKQLAQLSELKLIALGEAPWHAQQTERRSLRAWWRAVMRALINRLFGFAYFNRAVDLAPNLMAVMVHQSSSRPAFP